MLPCQQSKRKQLGEKGRRCYDGAMFIYAGIDEAGYGPLLGPLLHGRSVIGIEGGEGMSWDKCPDIWEILEGAICKRLSGRKHRIAVGDSKKLVTKAAGIKHLETGVLCFARQLERWRDNGGEIGFDKMLDLMGERSHRQLDHLPWYEPTAERPWDKLPVGGTGGEIAIASSMLKNEMQKRGVKLLDMGASVVFEDRFNAMIRATRNKASTSFTFVAGHLMKIWEDWGTHGPIVCVDRQGGRTRYLRILQINFPKAGIRILDESPERSAYLLTEGNRQMTVSFEMKGEEKHFPIALGSMVSKYTREMFMGRMNRFFEGHVPGLKPTAGYTQDGRRYLEDLEPHFEQIGITADDMIRIS